MSFLYGPTTYPFSNKTTQLAKILPPSRDEKAVQEEELLVDNVLKNFERTLGLMEDKVKEMDASRHPNASRARDKFEEAKNIKNNLERQKGRHLPKSSIKKYLDRIKQLNSEIDGLKKASSLTPAKLQKILSMLENEEATTDQKLEALDKLALYGTGSKQEVELLTKIREDKEEDRDVFDKASILLGSTGIYRAPKGGLPENWEEILNDIGNVSEERISIILSFKNKKNCGVVLHLLDGDDPPEIKILIIYNLERLVSDGYIQQTVYKNFVKLVREEPNVWIRSAALYNLRGVVPEKCMEEVLDLCADALESDAYFYRYSAVKTLGQLQHQGSLVPLEKALTAETDPDLKIEIEKWIDIIK